MGKTSAEPQRAFRERHAGEAKLSMVVSPLAKACLERLARHHCQTQRDYLEDMLIDMERLTTATMPDTSAYYAVTE